MVNPHTALTIGGSDPSGCGGIQGDIKVFSALGVFGMSVITALTCQNSMGVSEIESTSASLVASQFRTVYDDIKIDAVKIGMLSTGENVRAIRQLLRELEIKNIVLDPVFDSSSGVILLNEDGREAMISLLVPIVDIVTPNLYEAGILTGMNVSNVDDMKSAAEAIKKMGPRHVLVKGGHLEGKAIDVLYDGVRFEVFDAERIQGKEFRGTGCALSAAIAAALARGSDMTEAVKKAKEFVRGAINCGYDNLGKGMGTLNHNAPLYRG